jgi:succinate dehydrogenase assembly factor 1
MARLSGLQRDVLKLYRACIRAAYAKPKENRSHWVGYIHGEFAKYQSLPKKQFSVIEHLLRVGYRRYELYSSPQIKDIH